MTQYIDGPEYRGGIKYYTLTITPPPVSKNDPPKLQLTPIEALKLFLLDGNFVVVDQNGRWLIWNIKAGVDSDLNEKLLAALEWAEQNCTAQTKDPSIHVGFWRRYALHIFLSRDSTIGKGLKFIDQPGVRDFLEVIDQWFAHVDLQLYEEYCSVTPDKQRVLGKSFLMAVLNHGGSQPHIDNEDCIDGCCCVVPGKDWSGGELAFRDLHLKINAQPGDIIFFRSAQLYHENLTHIGDRRSIVLNTDANCFTAPGQIRDPEFLAEERDYNANNNVEIPPAPQWSVQPLSEQLGSAERMHSYLKNRLNLRLQNKEAAHKNKLIQRKSADWQP